MDNLFIHGYFSYIMKIYDTNSLVQRTYMTDQDYKLLLLLEEYQNITHTAALLYTSQSTLSKRIKSIEEELGVTLFIRSKHGIRFTAIGERILKEVHHIVDARNKINESIDKSLNRISGSIKIGISSNFAAFYLSDFMRYFHTSYPSVITRIKTGPSHYIYRDLWNNSIDVAIIRGEYHDWFGERYLMSSEPICLIHNYDTDIFKCWKYPYIERISDNNMEYLVKQWLQEQDFDEPIQSDISIDGIQTVVSMVSNQLGWAIVPEIGLQNFNGTIIPLTFKNGAPLVRSTYLLYQKTSLHLPQIQAFIDKVKEHNIS